MESLGERLRLLSRVLIAVVVVTVASAIIDDWLLPGTNFLQSMMFQLPSHELALRILLLIAAVVLALITGKPFFSNKNVTPQEQENHYRHMFMSAPAALVRSSLDGLRILDANEHSAKMLGYDSCEQMLRECHPSQLYVDKHKRDEMIAELQAMGCIDGMPIRLKKRNGSQIWIRFHAVLHASKDVIDSVFVEITEEKSILDKLNESEQLHRAIIANSPLGISVRDKTGRLLQCNEAWMRVWNMTLEHVHRDMEKERAELVMDERDGYLGQRATAVKRVYLHGGTAFIPECKTHQRRPGVAAWISQYFYAITDDTGQVNRVIIITDDISAKKKVEEERDKLVEQLQRKSEHVKLLSGLLPICSSCHKIRDDSGYWQQVDTFLQKHTQIELSHSLCPECTQRLYPEFIKPETDPNVE